jgi:L-amino acid N-acyltransferase YncA
MIRNAAASDAGAIARIYNYYVKNTVVTFEGKEVSPDEMRQRITNVSSSLPWFVIDDSDAVLGYAYATRWKERCAYRFSVEATIYLEPAMTGRGHGGRLFARLLEELRAQSVHCVFGAVALPNEASVALHERLGFRKAGHFEEVGFKFNRWIDVGYWQLLL